MLWFANLYSRILTLTFVSRAAPGFEFADFSAHGLFCFILLYVPVNIPYSSTHLILAIYPASQCFKMKEVLKYLVFCISNSRI